MADFSERNYTTTKFWAHSDPSGFPPESPNSHWQPLAEHLQCVAELASRLASLAAPQNHHFHDLARWSGLLHDYGKYTDCFQAMILGTKKRCPHAIHGAAMSFKQLQAPHVASAIAGHHAGMPDLGELRDKIRACGNDPSDLLPRAAADLPPIGALLQSTPPKLEHPGSRFDLLTRILHSCLVDADRLDTANRPLAQAPLNAAQRLEVLLTHIAELTSKSPNGAVKTARAEVLADCLRAASSSENIFSLSVPTGGGKTLAAMAFALRRAALQPDLFRRIIVVIPFLSIIEQNADVYARIFGPDAILEHHSGAFTSLREQDGEHFKHATDQSEQYELPAKRPETENWDAPLIVTTSVRFFESLFSNHPSDLRRVHNVARSIIILDEVQVLPRPLLAPLLGMMDELSRDWGCTFVLSTATKPAFERTATASNDKRWDPGKVHEIVAAPEALHQRLCRVSIDWRIKEQIDWPEVARWIAQEQQALCVVNLRDHAAKLYDELEPLIKDGSLFHLSTRMCAAHRLNIIAQIRQRLLDKVPCRVVSTQLIEAGVDLDFPIAFRALGPLDSIVQVAGRADREGTLTAALGRPAGRLVVFKPLDNRTPPNEYATATAMTEALAKGQDIQPGDLNVMTRFFDDYYGNADLGERFLEMRKNAEFKKLADEFEMISSRTRDVFVPYGAGKDLIDQLYKVGQLTGYLRRQLQRFTVGLQPWEFKEVKGNVLSELSAESNIWIASAAAYSREKGLQTSLDLSELVT